MKEQDAKNRLCPIFTIVHLAVESAVAASPESREVGQATARLAGEAAKCRGSACMMWRWQGREDGDAIATSKGHILRDLADGHCGLGGHPTIA